jgi:hypothetical protein
MIFTVQDDKLRLSTRKILLISNLKYSFVNI